MPTSQRPASCGYRRCGRFVLALRDGNVATPQAAAYDTLLTLPCTCSALQVMLLSDGSVTRHLQLLTGSKVHVVSRPPLARLAWEVHLCFSREY